jgi:hypothetical protein
MQVYTSRDSTHRLFLHPARPNLSPQRNAKGQRDQGLAALLAHAPHLPRPCTHPPVARAGWIAELRLRPCTNASASRRRPCPFAPTDPSSARVRRPATAQSMRGGRSTIALATHDPSRPRAALLPCLPIFSPPLEAGAISRNVKGPVMIVRASSIPAWL